MQGKESHGILVCVMTKNNFMDDDKRQIHILLLISRSLCLSTIIIIAKNFFIEVASTYSNSFS